jgi:hypothetical protein
MGGGGKVIGRRRPYSQGAGTGDIKRCDARKGYRGRQGIQASGRARRESAVLDGSGKSSED